MVQGEARESHIGVAMSEQQAEIIKRQAQELHAAEARVMRLERENASLTG